MLDNFFGFFEKLVLNFTWSRLVFLIASLTLVLVGLGAFEVYTKHFHLDRLERETKVLGQLVEMAGKVETLPRESQARATFERKLTELNGEIEKPAFNFELSPRTSRIVFATLPWIVLGLLVVLASSSGRTSALLGMALFAAPFILLGAWLPTFRNTWINSFAYPWGSMLLGTLSIVIWQRRRAS